MALALQPQGQRKKGNTMLKMSSAISAAALLGLIATAVPASAATLFYNFTPTTAGAQSFTFNVDSNPALLSSTPFQFTASVQNVTVSGVARSGITSFDFYSAIGNGGLFSSSIGSYGGPQLFSGAVSAPTLLTGRFSLSGGPSGASGILNVTSVVTAVPESGTWAMMIVGLGLAGSSLRRRKVTTRISYAA
jgi:hypothetical protein